MHREGTVSEEKFEFRPKPLLFDREGKLLLLLLVRDGHMKEDEANKIRDQFTRLVTRGGNNSLNELRELVSSLYDRFLRTRTAEQLSVISLNREATGLPGRIELLEKLFETSKQPSEIPEAK